MTTARACSWAVVLQARDAAAASRLRLEPGVEVLAAGDTLWIRGTDANDALRVALLALPADERFVIDDEGRLVRFGETIPRDRLPAGDWQSARKWFAIELPLAAAAGVLERLCPWRMQRASTFAPPNLLLTDWHVWHDYAIEAPQIRLQSYCFAVNARGQTLIRGDVPPPLPGVQYCEANGVGVEVGWECQPPPSPAALRRRLQCGPSDLILLHGDGTADVAAATDMVPASRSAVRATEDAIGSRR